MPKSAFVFLMVLLTGCFLVMVGLMGAISADCPRPLLQFPILPPHCAALAGCASMGLLLFLVGAIGTSVAGIYDAISQDRKIERSP